MIYNLCKKVLNKVLKLMGNASNILDNTKKKKEFLETINKQSGKQIYYFCIPTHINIGDQAIAQATLSFLKEECKEQEIIPIALKDTNLYLSIIKKKITDRDIVVIHGGGNIGNLYPSEEENRRKVIQSFPNNKIISMPQSIYFTEDENGGKELKKTQEIYENNSNLVLFAREKLSLEKMKVSFPNNKVLFSPDIVMSLEKMGLVEREKREGIITLIRKDIEASLNETEREKLFDLLKEKDPKVSKSDTRLKEQTHITPELREITLSYKWREISEHKIAVTDRLHGMIFAYITKTPVIVFDNSYKKVSETYHAFLEDCEYVEYIEEFSEEAVEKAYNKLLAVTNFEHDLSDQYADLVAAFKE